MAATTQDKLEPFLEQEPFLWDRHRYYGFISGVGAGKTAVGVMRDALNMEVWNPGRMGAIVAPTTQMVKNAILPLMREFGLMKRWSYNSPQSEEPGIVAPNGSRAVILSADNDRQIERLSSLNLAWFHVDESRDVPERARQILIQRLRKGEYTNGYFTSTPRGKNHDYDFFVGDVETMKRSYGDATLYEAGDRLAITDVPTDANPYLDQEDVQAIRDAHPEGLLQQEVEGSFVEVGGGLLTRDMLSFIRSEEVPDREMSWIIACDLAVEADPDRAQTRDSDFWAAAVIAYDGIQQQAYLIDVVRTRGMTKDQGVTWLQSLMDGLPTNRVYVESTQAQRWFVQDARNAGLNVVGIDQSRQKEERLMYLSVPFNNGDCVVVNHEDPGAGVDYEDRWREFVQEWVAFPDGRHDDMLDAVEMCLRQVELGASVKAYSGHAYGDK